LGEVEVGVPTQVSLFNGTPGHYTALPYNASVFSFIETKLFTRLVQEYLMDDDYRELQSLLMEQPTAGPVVRGSGGVRKLRWRTPGRGKSGGYRVIYYPKIEQGVIGMLTLYPKNVKDNIPAHMLRAIRDEVENG
jgi:mRNA-degrading endonuclease RelE of RelBE toxin-antitoxin system